METYTRIIDSSIVQHPSHPTGLRPFAQSPKPVFFGTFVFYLLAIPSPLSPRSYSHSEEVQLLLTKTALFIVRIVLLNQRPVILWCALFY